MRPCVALSVTVKLPMGLFDPTRFACNINPLKSSDYAFKDTEKEETVQSEEFPEIYRQTLD